MADSLHPRETPPEVPISRHWLESLSAGELVKLADNAGIDIPPGLERIFIIEELLENSNNGEEDEEAEQKPEDDLKINPSFSETAALPKHYNISYIEVIIRDPLWAFAFWEVKEHDREIHENADDFKGYCLRVIPLNEDEAVPKSRENSFTVSIDLNDSARYLGFAEHSPQSAGRYIILLCAIRGSSELQLASSPPFNLPKLIENENLSALDQNPLIHLSGARDLSIIRSTDRADRRSADRRTKDRRAKDHRAKDQSSESGIKGQ
jgi:hypothetical protein